MDDSTLAGHMEAVDDILAKYRDRVPGSDGTGPARILDHLYLGNFKDSNNEENLTALGVTHLLNCTAIYTGNRMMPMGLRQYRQLGAYDNETYDMLGHLEQASGFIRDARERAGKVLVYCAKGANRSAAICVAYLVDVEHCSLLDAVDIVARNRGAVLTNSGFRKQLIRLACDRECLNTESVATECF